ncbi:MAG TPA: hypothetical protein DCR44_04725 [Acholeplasmatales bacterium]|nr:hypothetical protein [Acholeplasmatales bacterium]
MKRSQKVRYIIDQFLSRGTLAIVLMLSIITFAAVLLIGILSHMFAGGDTTVFETLWTSLMQTLDPGNLSGVDGSFWYLLLMTIATIVGIFITSMLISVLSSGFQQKLENMQKGTSQVIEKGHTLLLGWNDNIPVIVSEIITANENVKRPVIVILSETDTLTVQDGLKAMMKDFKNTKVIVRRGEIHLKDNLEMCSIAHARSVVVAENDDVAIIKCLLGISQTAFFAPEAKGHVTAIFSDPQNLMAAKKMCGERLEAILLSDAMNRITAQTCLQPGLSFIYKELFDFEGNEFYFFNHPSLAGKTMKESLCRFSNATVCGLFKDGTPHINPKMDTVIGADDKLIVICEDDDKAILVEHHEERFADRIVKTPHKASRSVRRILFIGYNPSLLSVIEEMCPFVMKDSHLSFLVPTDTDTTLLDSTLRHCEVGYDIKKGVTYSNDALERLEYTKLDTIVVIANDLSDGERSDSETLLSIMHLKNILNEMKLDIPIIIEIERIQNEPVLHYASVDDFIVSNVLSNKMLCQIAENRHLNAVFNELLGEEGSEIYLKPAKHYVKMDEPVDFCTVVESAALKREIAIGFRLKHIHENGGVVLNPNKKKEIVFTGGDCVVVLAED